MLEKDIERKFCIKVKSLGGRCDKFVSPSNAGVPDRICWLPDGRVVLAEIKATGKTLRPLQLQKKKEYEALGFKVVVIDSIEDVNNFAG